MKIGKPKISKVRSRLERLTTTEIMNWADDAGSGVARALGDYRNLTTKEPQHATLALREAHQGLLVLLDAIEVLQERQRD